jgi:hypothetical protein
MIDIAVRHRVCPLQRIVIVCRPHGKLSNSSAGAFMKGATNARFRGG